ncbi:MarR family winged helix-turn-helix transcriptional regulator [Clostridium botulinum]|uniref:MarR family transcriptional regulator n=1 Tax=Clostridium botulinum TaxID=1491 RepID=A0A9Q1ZCM7_CLOBO|nr:MarR family transcriptional regulator [Clostridium botulinum]AEB75534.1 transcriptional regulator [Clostridium botulinum BKT015925]KEH99596.1 MarR family transcriptional regulator [Clostridium botulinum D str. 16868]KEI03528.1 MarR family transcriptional regulator [Clostridium botulinum C/D str. Sp77]KLU76881.1 MarR family transcriptional regulator [Clostridium botulinum V891]KOA73773.1 MarR family transcriptional regulator [Clostridium botulinum]
MQKYATESIGRYISHFFRLGSSFLGKEYRKYGIGSGQYQFLIQLYLEDGLSHDELTQRLSMDKATTTRAILKLEQEGYVNRVLNPNDKRKYYIYLTDKAKFQKKDIFNISDKWEQKLVQGLSEKEVDDLIYILRKIAKNNPGYFFKNEEENN